MQGVEGLRLRLWITFGVYTFQKTRFKYPIKLIQFYIREDSGRFSLIPNIIKRRSRKVIFNFRDPFKEGQDLIFIVNEYYT
jgi:hypothetical protein